MAEKVDPALEQLVKKLAGIVKLESFALFGGAVLDTILKRPAADYDIGIEGDRVDERMEKTLSTLTDQSFEILTKAKPHPFWISQVAYVTLAKKGELLLDIAVFPSYDNIRFFTVDSMYVLYPELKVVDTYDSMGAYERQEIKLARGIDQENPYRIATRAIRIGAKYGFPLQNAGSLWQELIPRLQSWQPNSDFEGPFAYAEARFKILKAIARSQNQPHFVRELLEVDILPSLFPESLPLLTELSHSSDWHVANDQELIARLMNMEVPEADEQAFKQQIDTIKKYGM